MLKEKELMRQNETLNLAIGLAAAIGAGKISPGNIPKPLPRPPLSLPPSTMASKEMLTMLPSGVVSLRKRE